MNTSNQDNMSPLTWVLLFFLSLLWGGSFFFAKIALLEVGPLTLVLSRVAIAAVVLGLFIRLKGKRLPSDPALWRSFGVMGVLNNLIPFSFLFWGQTHISGGLAAVLTATTPAFTVIVAHFATSDEKITAAKGVGVVLGLIGVGILFGVELSGGGLWILAMGACLVASLSYGVGAVYARRFKEQGHEPVTVAFGQVSATAVLMLPIALIIESPWALPAPAVGTVLAMLGLGMLSTALAYVLYFHILASAGATNLSLVTLLIPVSAIALGTVFLGERLAPSHFVGMAVIFTGLLAIDGRLSKLADRFRVRADVSRECEAGDECRAHN